MPSSTPGRKMSPTLKSIIASIPPSVMDEALASIAKSTPSSEAKSSISEVKSTNLFILDGDFPYENVPARIQYRRTANETNMERLTAEIGWLVSTLEDLVLDVGDAEAQVETLRQHPPSHKDIAEFLECVNDSIDAMMHIAGLARRLIDDYLSSHGQSGYHYDHDWPVSDKECLAAIAKQAEYTAEPLQLLLESMEEMYNMERRIVWKTPQRSPPEFIWRYYQIKPTAQRQQSSRAAATAQIQQMPQVASTAHTHQMPQVTATAQAHQIHQVSATNWVQPRPDQYCYRTKGAAGYNASLWGRYSAYWAEGFGMVNDSG